MPGLYVPQAEFGERMTWLAEEGYHAVTLRQVFPAWDDGEPIAENPVVISFDEGLRSHAVKAAGCEGATTTNEGLASPDESFTMRRIRIEPGDGASGLRQKLEAARSS